jgi:hypothetical protein
MGKLTTYLLIMSGIMLLMHYGGLINDGNGLLVLLLDPANITTSQFWTDVTTVISLTGLVGILATSIVTRDPNLAIFGTAAIAILNLGVNFINIFINLNTTSGGAYTPLLVLMFAPIMLLFFVTIMEWFRGITT